MLQGDQALASYASRAATVTVTLDGVANDGAPGERRDNVLTGSVLGGGGADVLTGNGASNMLNGRGGDDLVTGAGGDDRLVGDAGANRLLAGPGDDRVEGSREDTVKCGPGADVGAGLPVPGIYGDCETVFESGIESPDLTLGDIARSKRRPRVTLGWREYPPVPASRSPRSPSASHRASSRCATAPS